MSDFDYFRHAMQEARLAHAYLLSGKSAEELESTVREIARGILCENTPKAPCDKCNACKKILAGLFADFQWIDPDSEDGSSSVESLREILAEVFQLKPLEGTRRVVVLVKADQMTASAQDALLKILEEPPVGTVWLLASDKPKALHETVRSRCIPVRVGSQVAAVPAEIRSAATSLVQGSLSPMDVARALFGEKKIELAKKREIAKDLIAALLAVLRESTRSSESFGNREVNAIESCLASIGAIERQISPELVLENLAFQLRQQLGLEKELSPLRKPQAANTDMTFGSNQVKGIARR